MSTSPTTPHFLAPSSHKKKYFNFMLTLCSTPVKSFYTLTPLCSHFLNPHHMMVTARKYHLHFHTIMLSFRSKIHSIYIEIPFNIDIADKTRQNVMKKDGPQEQPSSVLSLSPPNVSQPIWNSSSKPKTSQDGVFSNRRTLRTNETTSARGGSHGTQRV